MATLKGVSDILTILSTDPVSLLSIIFILTSEPQGMDEEGDLQHCWMWQVLQWSHHCPVCLWDLGRGAHTWETPCPWWQAINCPHAPTFPCLYHTTNIFRTDIVDAVCVSGKSLYKSTSTCISNKSALHYYTHRKSTETSYVNIFHTWIFAISRLWIGVTEPLLSGIGNKCLVAVRWIKVL